MEFKRLIKKADVNLNVFIQSHLLYNQSTKSEIDQIINENQDCLYSGFAYRVLYFWEDDIKNVLKELLNSEGEEKVNSNNLQYYVLNTFDKLINLRDNYQSFSKSLDGAINVSEFFKDSDDLGNVEIIICYEVSNGLDIEKLVNKYKNTLSESALEAFEEFKGQKEVLAKFTNHDYSVVDMTKLKKLFESV